MPLKGETKYKPEMLDIIEREFKEGASMLEVASELGICKATLYTWIDPQDSAYNESVSDAVKKGVEKSEAWWTKKGRTTLHDNTFNPTLWYMNMKNRFGWSDKQENREVDSFGKESALDALEGE